MTNELMRQIEQDIRNYEKAIRNAEIALAEVERELEEELAACRSDVVLEKK